MPNRIPLKAVLLDIDGTLLDSNHAHARTWEQVLHAHGHAASYAQVRALIGKGGDKLLREVADIDAQSWRGEALAKERQALFETEWLPTLRAANGTRALLERFKRDGLQLIVATSAGSEELDSLLQQAGIADLINVSAGSGDAEESKPDPDIVKAALSKSGRVAEEVFMIGDTPYDIQAASAAGVPTVAVRSGGFWTDADFEGAAAVVDDPADLLARLDRLPLYRLP